MFASYRIGSEIPEMIAQNAKMAEMVAGAGNTASSWIPAVEGFVPAFPGDRSHQMEDGLSDSTTPCVAIAMSRIDPVTETRRAGCTTVLDVPDLAHDFVVRPSHLNHRSPSKVSSG